LAVGLARQAPAVRTSSTTKISDGCWAGNDIQPGSVDKCSKVAVARDERNTSIYATLSDERVTEANFPAPRQYLRP
jgi:hypothetical protein